MHVAKRARSLAQRALEALARLHERRGDAGLPRGVPGVVDHGWYSASGHARASSSALTIGHTTS